VLSSLAVFILRFFIKSIFPYNQCQISNYFHLLSTMNIENLTSRLNLFPEWRDLEEKTYTISRRFHSNSTSLQTSTILGQSVTYGFACARGIGTPGLNILSTKFQTVTFQLTDAPNLYDRYSLVTGTWVLTEAFKRDGLVIGNSIWETPAE